MDKIGYNKLFAVANSKEEYLSQFQDAIIKVNNANAGMAPMLFYA